MASRFLRSSSPQSRSRKRGQSRSGDERSLLLWWKSSGVSNVSNVSNMSIVMGVSIAGFNDVLMMFDGTSHGKSQLVGGTRMICRKRKDQVTCARLFGMMEWTYSPEILGWQHVTTRVPDFWLRTYVWKSTSSWERCADADDSDDSDVALAVMLGSAGYGPFAMGLVVWNIVVTDLSLGSSCPSPSEWHQWRASQMLVGQNGCHVWQERRWLLASSSIDAPQLCYTLPDVQIEDDSSLFLRSSNVVAGIQMKSSSQQKHAQ